MILALIALLPILTLFMNSVKPPPNWAQSWYPGVLHLENYAKPGKWGATGHPA
jgi:ABC-type glycerol-3-phosphate transport system permease component